MTAIIELAQKKTAARIQQSAAAAAAAALLASYEERMHCWVLACIIDGITILIIV